MEREQLILWLAVIAYVVAGVIAIFALVLGSRRERGVALFMWLGLALHAVAIGLRWERVGHGPYITMFEILSSNIFTLMLFFALVYWRYRPIRHSAAVVLPILFVMMGWMMLSPQDAGHRPPTFDTIWLWIHIGFGKIFMGAMLAAVGIGGIILLRRSDWWQPRLASLPDDRRLDNLAFRFVALGLIFDSLMLIAGAIWAQDAWGRYWAWDPLETWSFITWLVLVIALHLRVTFRMTPRAWALLVQLVFVIGFVTFFGIPFVSTSPHKGTFS